MKTPHTSNQLNLFGTKEGTVFNNEELDKEYFELFSWALPLAFSDPLGLCRFEEGDMIYNTPKAYLSPWSEALKHVKYGIQVTFPPRAVQKISNEEDDSVFESNWRNLLELDILTFEDNKFKNKKHIKTTQGALYTFLWKEDWQVFEEEKGQPDIPSRGKALKDMIEDSREFFLKELNSNHNFSEAFIMPYDKSNSLLSGKFFSILTNLKKIKVSVQVLFGRPKNNRKFEFSPTSQFACFVVDSSEKTILHDTVKKLVYKPSKDRKTNKDNFRIKAHGILLKQK